MQLGAVRAMDTDDALEVTAIFMPITNIVVISLWLKFRTRHQGEGPRRFGFEMAGLAVGGAWLTWYLLANSSMNTTFGPLIDAMQRIPSLQPVDGPASLISVSAILLTIQLTLAWPLGRIWNRVVAGPDRHPIMPASTSDQPPAT